MPSTVPGTWDEFMNKVDKIPYPQRTYFHGKNVIKKLNMQCFLVSLRKTRDLKKKYEETIHADT